MLDQTFSLPDIPRVFTVLFLEAILSIDNALVLALIVKQLPSAKRAKALFIGLCSSFILRGVGLVSAAYLIHFLWIKLLGGGYLIYLSISHLVSSKNTPKRSSQSKRAFWKTVALIECTDFVFAIDSILAGVALIGVPSQTLALPPKLWVVYLGGISGLIFMRCSAKVFSQIIERYPKLETYAYLIVGWIGIKLTLEAMTPEYAHKVEGIFWLGISVFFLLGFVRKKTASSKNDTH